jgi:hypothetical protein
MWLIWMALVAVFLLALVWIVARRRTDALNAAMNRHPAGKDRQP